MPSLLVQHATLRAILDDRATTYDDGGMYIVDNVIRQVGPTDQLPPTADRVIDARGMLILPGLINTHHHFYQTLTRAVPQAQNADLFNWLRTLYPIWARYRLDTLAFAGGAIHDPLAALVFCHPPHVDLSVINGKIRIEDGQLLGIDLPPLIDRHNAIARAMVRGD